jgi:hypothetical protein
VTAAAQFLRDDCPPGVLPGSGARPAYFFYPELTTSEPCGEGSLHLDAGAPPGHMHNPAGLYGMLGDALTLYYAYSGDAAALALIPPMFDYVLANGTTPVLPHWVWPGVPYASSTGGDLYFSGAADEDVYGCFGCGDGYGIIEPDKLGELGVQMLTLYKIGKWANKEAGKAAAIHYADVLCANFREPSTLGPQQSPWPFRVNAQTGRAREDYSAAILGPIRLLDELIRLDFGSSSTYKSVRSKAWRWMMEHPMRTMWWCAYFEDVGSFGRIPDSGGWQNNTMSNGTWYACNYNQYSPMETAKSVLRPIS